MRTSDAYLRQYINQHCFRQWLAPGRCQAISWTNAGILLTGPSETKFSDFFYRNSYIIIQETHLKMSSGKCRRFYLGLSVLTRNKRKWSVTYHFLFGCPQTRGVWVHRMKVTFFYLWSSVLGDIPFGMEFEQIRRYSKFHGPLNVTKYNVRQCCRFRTY